MRIAVSSEGSQGLESIVSPHFGRCPYFILIDLEGREVAEVKAIENPFFGQHQPGQVPGFIHSQGVDVMLTGGMGHRAIGFFQQYNIQPVTGAQGSVASALKQYLAGTLQESEPCAESEKHQRHH
jgi:predicted Fe-Mo cluster-binding NifX family protein